MENPELEMYQKNYDYTNYSHRNHINVIPEEDFKRLITDSFKSLTDVLRKTYGPYGSSVMMSEQSQTILTKDGYNVFQQLGPSHTYKRLVYLALNKIITRVNKNVGDGTTSCMLLAEKIFNNVNNILNTPDEKRLALDILNDIEDYLQDLDYINDDIEDGEIEPLTEDNLKPVIAVAANYDNDLVNILYDAMKPEVVDGKIKIRSVGVRKEVDDGIGSTVKYDIDYLPGDYRVGVNTIIEDRPMFAERRKIKCVLYDHNFNTTDWTKFMENFKDDEDIMIIARDVNPEVIKDDYMSYRASKTAKKKLHMKDPVTGKDVDTNIHIFIFPLLGDHRLDELNDLGAVLGIKPIGVYDKSVVFEDLKYVDVSLYKDDCLTFFDLKGNVDTSTYITSLRDEVRRDKAKSLVRTSSIEKRIKAIEMSEDETVLSVMTGSTLDSKLLGDKIDDCLHIVESAINTGVVPNLFRYVYDRLWGYYLAKNSPLCKSIIRAITDAIKGLFTDIWISKYGYDVEGNISHKDALEEHMSEHFTGSGRNSFDIIKEEHVDMNKFATSAQYDLEVVSASIAIVKYLITSKALVFDAHILKPVNDEYDFVK